MTIICSQSSLSLSGPLPTWLFSADQCTSLEALDFLHDYPPEMSIIPYTGRGIGLLIFRSKALGTQSVVFPKALLQTRLTDLPWDLSTFPPSEMGSHFSAGSTKYCKTGSLEALLKSESEAPINHKENGYGKKGRQNQ